MTSTWYPRSRRAFASRSTRGSGYVLSTTMQCRRAAAVIGHSCAERRARRAGFDYPPFGHAGLRAGLLAGSQSVSSPSRERSQAPRPFRAAIEGRQMQIAVIGLGYVGLVTATCLARLGQQVVGLEVDAEKIESLERGEAPYYEPGLQPELTLQQREARLRFTLDPEEALRDAEVVLVCVGTPSAQTGEADLSAVRSVFDTLGRALDHPVVVALRSTVPMGTT